MLEVNFSPFPVLSTERLILRATGPEDVTDMYEMRSNKEVMDMIGRPVPKSEADVLELIGKIQNFVAANEAIAWSITLRDSGKYAGTISLHVIIKEHYRAEVGYMLLPAYYRQGILDEALKAVIHYGFNTLGLHSIEAQISPVNTASRKLVERNHFVQEAYFKENCFKGGKFVDTVVYSLVNSNSSRTT